MVQEGELVVTSRDLTADSLNLVDDSILEVPEAHYAILLTPPQPLQPDDRPPSQYGVSFILSGLFILFLIAALRFRNNLKYIGSIFRNLIEVRTRHNVFDDTVRETSLVILLNLLWCCSAGIILFGIYSYLTSTPVIVATRTVDICVGMIAALCYTLFLCITYYGVGWIFSDTEHAVMWLKGFTASQGLMSPAFFIIALISISYPYSGKFVFIASAIIFILVKIVFIWKGYRIFFSQFSSWVLFLCYLCSLEIVPLYLTYKLAIFLGEII